ncbi:DUF1761 domain-containing protein [bacterium]|nr:MAG: DUF1761 domain-containing protein [bacterium]
MDLQHPIQWAAVPVAALTGFLIGGLWYGPLFRTPWMAASGMSFERGRQQNVPLVFGLTYVLNVIAAIGLSICLGPGRSWLAGLHVGVFVGLLFVATALGVIYLFESRPLRLWLINAGYMVVNTAAMGTVLGAWP